MSLSPYQNFIAVSRYARWRDDLNRRETWEETVTRLIEFWDKHANPEVWKPNRERVFQAILNLDVMPSMRTLMTAGKALERDNVAGFNCAYRAVDDIRAFDEILYILMCGTGVGFSVERAAVDKLPEVADEFVDVNVVINVSDSKLGWAGAYKQLIALLYAGSIPKLDYSAVRPAGARLKTFGGRASGPAPLKDLCDFTVRVFKEAAGRKLTSLECHDLVCMVAQSVVVGGVRRSALISISDITDEWMRTAKSGQWWLSNPQRALANNSAIHKVKPTAGLFLKEWNSLIESGSGERGIFNRDSAKRSFEFTGRQWKDSYLVGTNPCGEILLRSAQFCNLTEVVARLDDTEESLKEKVEIASLLGTLQSTLTNFRYLSAKWKRNTEEERLLGVSITGIYDCPLLRDESVQDRLRKHAWMTHGKLAFKMGISESVSITTVKPSGTVSQLVDSASGIHPRHAPYYIRRVRCDVKDPVCKLLVDSGVPHEPDVYNAGAMVFSFPIASAAGETRETLSAIDHLEMWKKFKMHWTDHNPSVTITVDEDEWVDVAAWVYGNFDIVGGLSFLPKDKHTYQQAPYETISEEGYNTLLKSFPSVDWSKLPEYEESDQTTSAKELACSAGQCEI